MKRKAISFFITIIFLVFLSSCHARTVEESPDIVAASNKFAVNFYREIESENRSNIFFSPFSIVSAFGMAYEGAREKTSEEIQSVFLLPTNEKRLNGFLSLNNLLNEKKQNCTLKLASAYWLQENFNLLKTYTDIIKKYYQAEAYNVDFLTKPEQSIDRINEWAEEKTAGKIKKFLNYGSIDSNTRLILTNAVYFKGFWQTQFDKKLTTPDDFHIDKTRNIRVQMMQQCNKEFPYYEDENFQIVKIPYECKNLSMLILLPRKINSEIPKIPDYETLKTFYKALVNQKLDLYLPKFKIEATYDLVKPLRNLGLKSAFNPMSADFSGITGSRDLFISKAIQKSFVEVNEEGTEAAAVTGIVMRITAARPDVKKIFKADHPFIFLIIEENTGLIVFAGKVVQP